MSPYRLYQATVLIAVAAALHLALAPLPVPVLLFHDVNPHRPGWDFWTLAPEKFTRLCDLIDRCGLRGISLGELREHLAGRLPRARVAEAVVITCDDGFASTATLVGPELARRGQRAAFFVVAGWKPPEHVSDDQVRELSRAGFDVGAHGMTHTSLIVRPRQDPKSEESRIAGELADSRAKLERTLMRPVPAVAYPKGDWTELTCRLARDAGYALAFTTDSGYVSPGDDPLRLPRLQLNWDTPDEWVEAYLMAPHRERDRNLALVAAIAVLGLAAALVARPRAK